REIISAMSSACASVDMTATTTPKKTAFIARFPTSPANEAGRSLASDKANIGRCAQGALRCPHPRKGDSAPYRRGVRPWPSEDLLRDFAKFFRGLWRDEPKFLQKSVPRGGAVSTCSPVEKTRGGKAPAPGRRPSTFLPRKFEVGSKYGAA